jgi:beta-glucanase (GH16 family)
MRGVLGGVFAAAFAGGLAMIWAGGVQPLSAHAQQPVSTVPTDIAGHPPGDAFFTDFSEGHDTSTQYLSDFDVDADWVLMSFRKENVLFSKEGMSLLAQRNRGGSMPYTMAEYQRQGFYGFGRYEVVTRASGVPGVVSAFFTHTNEYFGDPHFEIDVEFVGKSPRAVHLNYFTASRDDPLSFDLWFDASKGYHLYAFEWSPDSIVWYVDNVEVRRVTRQTSPVGIPFASSRVIANIWTGNRQAEEWVGPANFQKASASYRCMSHVPAGKTGKQCGDVFMPPARE